MLDLGIGRRRAFVCASNRGLGHGRTTSLARADSSGTLVALTVLVPTLLFLGPACLWASNGPRPPCGGEPPSPPYAEVGAPPNALVWSGDDVQGDAWPPPCSGWGASNATTVVALAARFQYGGDVDELLGRLGAVSDLARIRYWSVSDGAWRQLFDEVGAVTVGGHVPRGDFSAAEMRAGSDLYFYQNDSRPTGGAVYRLRVRQVEPNRLVVAVDNVTPVKLLLVTLFAPGGLRSITFLDRLSTAEGVWGYYSLTRSAASVPGAVVGGHEASYLNRAVALYRHVAGIPTEQEPPLAP